jgi:VWFA-related protein
LRAASRQLLFGAWIAFAAAGTAPLYGQSAAAPTLSTPAAEPTQSGMTLQVFTRETVVDVVVTEGKGQAVHGLTRGDFTIEEDGKAQIIRGFQEYVKDVPPPERPAPKLPPNVYSNVQPGPQTSAVNILLLDALNTQPADQVFMKQEAIRYVKGMPKGTRIAVLGLSSRLRILQGFTADPAILVAAVDSKRNRALPSPFIDSDTGDTVASLLDVVEDGTAASLQEFQSEQSIAQQDMRNRMTLEALNQIAAYVAGIKGRKNLIWFSAGMPLSIFPTQAANGASGGTNDLQGMADYSKDVRKTSDLMTSAEVSVYPVDARGLFNNPANSAAVAATDLSGRDAAQKGAKDAQAQLAFAQKTGQEHLSMEAVAEATGGMAFYNTNDLRSAVANAVENGSNYYSVSYATPDPKFDGRYHSITIKVDKPGLRVSYRRGYNSDDIAHNAITPGLSLSTTAPEPYGTTMQAAMARGVPISSEILFTVRVEPSTVAAKPVDMPIKGSLDPKLASKPLVRYDVQYVFPARQLMFVDAPGGVHKGSVQFDVAAYDVYGKPLNRLSQTISLPLSSTQYQQMVASHTPFQFFQQLDLPPGEVFLRVGVLDEQDDKAGTLEIPLTVRKSQASNRPAVGGTQ